LLGLSPIFAFPVVFISNRIGSKIKSVFSLITVALFLIIQVDVLFVIKYLVWVFLAIILFRLFWNSIMVVRKEALKNKIKIIDLEEGMVPSEEIYTGESKIKTKARGLTMEEIEMLKGLQREGKMETIEIKKTTPFAPVILIGLVISLVFGDIMLVISGG
jgi:prepilin signal peptidase PulO-like enzyme (type II secretory pathway)